MNDKIGPIVKQIFFKNYINASLYISLDLKSFMFVVKLQTPKDLQFLGNNNFPKSSINFASNNFKMSCRRLLLL